jgi:hypothetical protein
MYPKIKQIVVTWRKGKSYDRIPIAIVKKNESEGTTFRYIEGGVEKAKQDGFVCFPDFLDVSKIYNQNVLQVLSYRINDPERPDIEKYYRFWEIPDQAKGDIYRILAYTQGQLPTDNFEFLAEYYSVTGVRFVSEITGFSVNQIETGCIHEGDILEWKLEPRNEFDKNAVALYCGMQMVGHVKRFHNSVFHLKNSRLLKVKVKKVEQNGHVSKAYILIYSE